MNEEYLARAREKVKDVRLFINGVSRRAAQLAKPGTRRLVHMLPDDKRSNLDIALLEVAEGKVIITSGSEEAQENAAQKEEN